MMKRFLSRLFLFALLIALPALALNAFLDRQMKALRYEDASVWNDIYKGDINADILVCGSSRAATHIDPALITQQTGYSCYNLGMMGHNFFIEDARYRVYRQHNRKPRLIILSLDYESLQRRPDLFNHTQFLAYLQDPVLQYATKQYEGFSAYDYRIPLLKYVGEQTLIFSLFRNSLDPSRNKPDRVKGFFARDGVWDKQVDAILDTLKPYTVTPDSLSIHSFESFLADCQQEHIRVVFVHTPVHPSGQQKVKNRVEMINVYHYYADRNNIRFYDYASDTMCRNKAYFMNSTHLNSKGAAYFTRKMIAGLQQDSVFVL